MSPLRATSDAIGAELVPGRGTRRSRRKWRGAQAGRAARADGATSGTIGAELAPGRTTRRSCRKSRGAQAAKTAAAVLTALLLSGCTTDPDSLLLLPVDGGDLPAVDTAAVAQTLGDLARSLPDVRSATVLETAPGEGVQACRDDVAEGWVEDPVDAPVVALPGLGYTVVRSAPTAVPDVTLTMVCDLDADGNLVVADVLTATGTTQSVGNDYAVRAGSLLGRVDVGIPDQAVVAVQAFEDWSLLMPLDPDMAVLRLHALEGGSNETGYDVGTIHFLDADGTDVTAASVPIPDVVHGVPRNRGSSVNPRD